MLLTKRGLKLWGSGMIVVIMSVLLTLVMTEDAVENMSLTEAAIIVLVLFPLALGWVQRWYWTKGEPDDTVETL